jgi:hypothetical protein
MAAPRRNHRQDEPATILQEVVIDVAVVGAYLLWNVSQVEFHRATAARLQVDEEKTATRIEHIARMRFAMENLLRRSAIKYRPFQCRQCVPDQVSVSVAERGRAVCVPSDDVFGFIDPVGEVRCCQIELPHSSVELLECSRIADRAAASLRTGPVVVPKRAGGVIRPERDEEAGPAVDPRFDMWLGSDDRASGVSETPSQIELDRVESSRSVTDSSQNIAGEKAQRKFRGVTQDDRVLDCQPQARGGGHCGVDCSPKIRWLHRVMPWWTRMHASAAGDWASIHEHEDTEGNLLDTP